MITYTCTENDYTFLNNEQVVAYGGYDEEGFLLFHNDQTAVYGNAMQAFCELKLTYEPNRIVSPQTMEMFTTPARAIDNMSKFRDSEFLKDVTEEVMFAGEHK